MEKIFNFKRFWLLVLKHANDNWKTFLYSLIVIFVSANIKNLGSPGQVQEYPFYVFFLVLIGGIYTSMFYMQWGNRIQVLFFLMLPATAFEKIALYLFYSVIVFIPVFTIVYFGSEFIIQKIMGQISLFSYDQQFHNQSSYPIIATYILIIYLFFQSFFLICAVWFEKRQLTKALGIIMIAYIIIYFGKFYIQHLTGVTSVSISNQMVIFPTDIDYRGTGGQSWENYVLVRSVGYYKITSLLIANISLVVLSVLSMLFYVASYFKLREKEI
jgi:hypothetical protein